MGIQEKLQELRNGFETAYIDKTSTSNLAYKPQFISNDHKQGKKVLSSIEDELMTAISFRSALHLLQWAESHPYCRFYRNWKRKG